MSSDWHRERVRVRDVAYDDIKDIRDREYQRFTARSPLRTSTESRALVRVPSEDPPSSRSARRDDYEVDRVVRRNYLDVPDRDYERREVIVYHRARRPRDSDRDRDRGIRSVGNDDGSDDGSSDDDDDDRYHRRHRRARSAAAVAVIDDDRGSRSRPKSISRAEEKRAEDDGYLWYSHKKRCEANFLERHFDSSYDGLIAGVAGAAIGSITAARFGGSEHKTLKAVGGALLGAAAFNSVENHYRVFTETREEIAEKKEKIKEQLQDVASAAGHVLD